jgi:hypothetical protein
VCICEHQVIAAFDHVDIAAFQAQLGSESHEQQEPTAKVRVLVLALVLSLGGMVWYGVGGGATCENP